MRKRRCLSRFSWIRGAAGLLFLMCLWLLVSRVRFLCVLSGSMEPALPAGSLIGLVSCPLSAVQPGDLVTYQMPDGHTRVTHRVTRTMSKKIYTKGDANQVEDALPVTEEELVGKVWVCIPLLGSCIMELRRGGLKTALAVCGAMILGLIFLRERTHSDRSGENEP